MNVKRTIFNCASFVFGMLGVMILAIVLFAGNSTEYAFKNEKVSVHNLGLLLLGLLFMVFFLFVGYKLKSKLNGVCFHKLICILSVILFVIEFFISYGIYLKTGWDAGILNEASDYMVQNPGENMYSSYYIEYPNNVFLLFLITVMKKISSLFSCNGYYLILFFGVLINNISILLVSLLLYKITNSKYISLVGWGIAVLLYGMSPWMCIAYSDTFSVLFSVLTLYIYALYRKKECPLSKKIGYVSIVPVLGYFIKPQCIIVLIAIALIELFGLNREKIRYIWSRKWKILLAFVQVGIAVIVLVGTAHIYTIVPIMSDSQKGMTHFVMMGLNEETNGTFSGEDASFTKSFPTKEEKRQANIEVIKERLSDMKGKRLALHTMKKVLVNFNDGTFVWGMEDGERFYTEEFNNLGEISEGLKKIFYNEGEYYEVFSCVEQAVWLVVLFLAIIFFFLKRRTKTNLEYIITLAIVGISMFNMLFEARARYFYCYAPVFVIMACLTINEIRCSFKEKCTDVNTKVERDERNVCNK